MRRKPELTAVFVEAVDSGTWSIGGQPVVVAAHLEVKVTAGTNSEDEREAFVAAAAGLLREVMGEALQPETYVFIDKVPSDAWRYDGQTQVARRTRIEAA